MTARWAGPDPAPPLEVTLSGTAVRLEPLRRTHVAALAAAAGEDRAAFGLTTVPHGAAEAATYVDSALAEARAGNHLPFAVVALPASGGHDRPRIVGSTRFIDLAEWRWPPGNPRQRHGLPDAVEIGATWLAASARRTAVNTEAKLLLLRHAFEVWDVHRVRFKTDVRNAQSRASIERLGAVFEGVLRADRPGADGTLRDSAYYSILVAEWPAVRAALTERLAIASAPPAPLTTAPVADGAADWPADGRGPRGTGG